MSAADIVVIGAGSVGANVAYRLAERGAKVTVLEAETPGAGTSGTSFAWTNSFHKTPRDYHELNTAGMAEHLALVSELGDGDWHKQEGALAWEDRPLGRARLKETVERLGSWGYPVEIISPHDARKLEPDLQIAPHVDEVVFTPSEGYVDVVPLIGRLLAHAVRRGARVLSGQRVTGVIREGMRVRGVTTAEWRTVRGRHGRRLRGTGDGRGGPPGRGRDSHRSRAWATDLHDARGQHSPPAHPRARRALSAGRRRPRRPRRVQP